MEKVYKQKMHKKREKDKMKTLTHATHTHTHSYERGAAKEMTIKQCERVAQKEMEQKQSAGRSESISAAAARGASTSPRTRTRAVATTLAIKAAYGFYDSINLKCSMPNNKMPLLPLRPNYLAEMSRSAECAR